MNSRKKKHLELLNNTIDDTRVKMIKLESEIPIFCDEELNIIHDVMINLDYIKNELGDKK